MPRHPPRPPPPPVAVLTVAVGPVLARPVKPAERLDRDRMTVTVATWLPDEPDRPPALWAAVLDARDPVVLRRIGGYPSPRRVERSAAAYAASLEIARALLARLSSEPSVR